ncbi:MAG: hypothetical protein AB1847_14810 [bacterium]
MNNHQPARKDIISLKGIISLFIIVSVICLNILSSFERAYTQTLATPSPFYTHFYPGYTNSYPDYGYFNSISNPFYYLGSAYQTPLNGHNYYKNLFTFSQYLSLSSIPTRSYYLDYVFKGQAPVNDNGLTGTYGFSPFLYPAQTYLYHNLDIPTLPLPNSPYEITFPYQTLPGTVSPYATYPGSGYDLPAYSYGSPETYLRWVLLQASQTVNQLANETASLTNVPLITPGLVPGLNLPQWEKYPGLNPSLQMPDTSLFTDLEAEVLAMEISGELLPPPSLYAQIHADLMAIRRAYPQVASVQNCGRWVPGELIIVLTKEATAQWVNGSFHGFDVLNAFYGPATVKPLSVSFISWGFPAILLLKFSRPYNPECLAQIYSHADGVLSVSYNGYAGDNDFIKVDFPFYTFSHGEGDCLCGCLTRHTWVFSVINGQPALLEEQGPPPGTMGMNIFNLLFFQAW